MGHPPNKEKTMSTLKDYFEKVKGKGVLCTSGKGGSVNAAVFATPHFIEDGSLAFIMPERMTYANLVENPNAHYLFMEQGAGYKGKRLYLKKIGQETDTERLYSLRRRQHPDKDRPKTTRHLVFFALEKELPLIGTGDE
jgi:hypothetical protein